MDRLDYLLFELLFSESINFVEIVTVVRISAFLFEGLFTQVGDPRYYVNMIKLKWEIIWTGGLPHLPGVPHLHVNRPLNASYQLSGTSWTPKFK